MSDPLLLYLPYASWWTRRDKFLQHFHVGLDYSFTSRWTWFSNNHVQSYRSARWRAFMEAAYAAGLFDGEGTVTLTKEKPRYEFRQPNVSVASTTYELLEFLKQRYGGAITAKRNYQEHHKPSWTWRLTCRRAILFLEDIIPYMKEPSKKYRAKLIVDEYLAITPRNGRFSESQKIAKRAFEQRFFHPSTPSHSHEEGAYESLASLPVSCSPDGVSIASPL